LDKGEDTLGQLRLDMDSLKRQAFDVARSLKAGFTGDSIDNEIHDEIDGGLHERRREEIRERMKEKRMPKPKEWLGYSWQHNLRNGLISLFSGVGLGIFLYYMAQIAINDGAIRSLEEIPNVDIRGIEPLVTMIWLVALIPVLKGIAQVLYAAFFAESIASLTEKFLPAQPIEHRPPVQEYIPLNETPTSVTERTTQFFEDASRPANRESQ
jgi:hypothetical protein